MSNFWPSGIDISDTQSPKEILTVAQQDWYKSSSEIIELVLQDTTSDKGHSRIRVHAKHVPSNRTSILLSVIQRSDNPYPVTIEPEGEKISSHILGKSYYSDLTSLVSETPAEFRKNLGKAFNLGVVKIKILNLVSGTSNALSDSKDDAQEDSSENQS